MTWSRAIEQEMPDQSQGSESRLFQFDNTRNGSSYIASLKAVRALTVSNPQLQLEEVYTQEDLQMKQ